MLGRRAGAWVVIALTASCSNAADDVATGASGALTHNFSNGRDAANEWFDAGGGGQTAVSGDDRWLSPIDSAVEAPGLGTPADHEVADASAQGDAFRCQLGQHQVCLDFENGALGSSWKEQGMGLAVDSSKAAHGGAALHFSKPQPNESPFISTTVLGAITQVLWGRFFLYMDAGAPDGHGALVEAYDQSNNWYELGFQFSSYHGNWHPPGGVPERYMNSDTKIPRQIWTCVEFLFDGAKPDVTKIWSNGVEVKYTMVAGGPGPLIVQQFKRIEIGFRPFHGTSLGSYEGTASPALTDMWIDDLALDPKRIGCTP